MGQVFLDDQQEGNVYRRGAQEQLLVDVLVDVLQNRYILFFALIIQTTSPFSVLW